MIVIDLGHRFGRVGRIGPDGQPDVSVTELDGTDGILDPAGALPQLFPPTPVQPAAAPAEPARSAVLGLPATGGREEELRRAVENAGIEVERVVPDPVAVALHYGAVAEGVDHTVLVCDHGATTLYLSVLAIAPDLTVRVVQTRGLRLGGDDWDAAIAAELAGRLPDGVEPRRAAETLRRALGESDGVTELVTDAEGGRHSVTLDRATFERAVAPLRESMLGAVGEQLAATESPVDTVLLAGGLCAMPGRRAEIEELPAAQGLSVRCELPELAVVRGLLALPDFGVLRIITGPAPRPGRAEAGYVLRDPLPAASVTDPDPRTGSPPPRDPEPDAHRGGGPAATGSGRQAATASPPGTGHRFPGTSVPPESGTAGPPPHTTPPPHTPVGGSGSAPEPTPGPPDSPDPPDPPDPQRTVPGEPSHPDSSGAADFPPPATDPPAAFAVPVGQLQAIRRGDHLLVLWAWPEGALSARVRWRREGSFAGQGPQDRAAVCRRRVYEHDGGFDLAVGRGAVTLTVEALVADLNADVEGASSLRVPAEPPIVEYEPTVRRRLRGRVASVTFTSATGCDLPGLHIVHSLGRFRPTSTAEGTTLYEVSARRLPAGTPLTVEFPLPATRGPSWLVCFPADPNAGTDSGIDIRPTALHRLRVT